VRTAVVMASVSIGITVFIEAIYVI